MVISQAYFFSYKEKYVKNEYQVLSLTKKCPPEINVVEEELAQHIVKGIIKFQTSGNTHQPL
jgi:hypothetical protein